MRGIYTLVLISSATEPLSQECPHRVIGVCQTGILLPNAHVQLCRLAVFANIVAGRSRSHPLGSDKLGVWGTGVNLLQSQVAIIRSAVVTTTVTELTSATNPLDL